MILVMKSGQCDSRIPSDWRDLQLSGADGGLLQGHHKIHLLDQTSTCLINIISTLVGGREERKKDVGRKGIRKK